MKILIFSFLILFTSFYLNAELLDLSISYVGISVASVTMENKEHTITVKTNTGFLISLASQVDNTYQIKYKENYFPLSYHKNIDQNDFAENNMYIYDHDNHNVTVYSYPDSTKEKSYEILPESRDFFSALYYLRGQLHNEEGSIILDVNKIPWQVNYQVVDREGRRTALGRIPTKKVRLEFTKLSDQPKEHSDILTSNLVSESNNLLFWFSDDDRNIPVRARFDSSPFPVIWKLNSYEDQ
jgi:hypothetical protein